MLRFAPSGSSAAARRQLPAVPLRGRATCLRVSNKLVLTPIGSGTCEHLGGGDSVPHAAAVVLWEGMLQVGRTEPADIILRIPTVSSRHAIISVAGETVRVADVNSTNGTSVNGADVKPMDYTDVPLGATIVFGDEHLAKYRLDKVADDPTTDTAEAAAGAPPAPEAAAA